MTEVANNSDVIRAALNFLAERDDGVSDFVANNALDCLIRLEATIERLQEEMTEHAIHRFCILTDRHDAEVERLEIRYEKAWEEGYSAHHEEHCEHDR
jgi:hypothetical protein